jgi:DNA-directed RNA polymerase sigma subunit (sigma70/sigma32)
LNEPGVWTAAYASRKAKEAAKEPGDWLEFMNRFYRQRDIEVWRRRDEGEKLAAIGPDFGISRERVRQIHLKIERRRRRALSGSPAD